MAPNGLEKLRVLVIDDNHAMIKIVRTILRGFGVNEIIEARDPIEAFQLYRREGVDLVIVDFVMDRLDGVDLTRLIRTSADSPNHYVPVIMLSAYSERDRVVEARDAGVTEFCCKPVRPADLYRKIAACIMRPRAFVRAMEYFGPCRRRRAGSIYEGPERRDNAGRSANAPTVENSAAAARV